MKLSMFKNKEEYDKKDKTYGGFFVYHIVAFGLDEHNVFVVKNRFTEQTGHMSIEDFNQLLKEAWC